MDSGLSASRSVAASRSQMRSIGAELRQWHRPLVAAALTSLLVAIVATVGVFTDDRMLVGVPIWHKAAKFGVSITIYTLTIAWLLKLLPVRGKWVYRLGTAIAFLITAELALIVLQIIRGRTSHFNNSTAFDSAVFYAMGAMVALVWTINLVLGIVLFIRGLPQRTLSASLRWGTMIGLIGMALALLMNVGEFGAVDMENQPAGIVGAHSVGVRDGGPAMPITGWNTEAGDLRVPHFVGIHGLQAVPLVGLAVMALGSRWARLRSVSRQVWLVRVFALTFLGLLAIVTSQAMRGHPISDVDGQTLIFGAVLSSTAALAVVVVLFAPPANKA